ncbi:MAG: MFS transporter [Acidimicrobiia bacterium]
MSGPAPLAASQSHALDPRRWRALTLVSLAQFMVILDITVVNVALPSIGQELSLGRAGLTWIVAAYTLAFGGLMLLGGRLADLVGRRRIFITGLLLFTIASMVSGASREGTVLIIARAAQGVGAALLSPAALAIITTTFHGAERNRALGVWAAIAAAGSAVGVLLGGALTSGPGWRWAFYINVPVGLAVIAMIGSAVDENRTDQRRERVDFLGAGLVTLSVALLIAGLIGAGQIGWTAPSTLTLIAAGSVLLAVFIAVERRHSAPLLRTELLARRNVSGGVVTMLAASGLLIGAFFLTSLVVQRVLGMTALETGLAFLPVAVATGVGAHVGAHLVTRLGGRGVALLGFGMAAVGFGLLASLPADAGIFSDVLPGFILSAAGLGAALVTATSTALAQIESHIAGMTSGVINTAHELGAALGVGFMSSLLGASLPSFGVVGGAGGAYRAAAIAAAVIAVVTALVLPKGRLELGDEPILAH